jgi:hypothetical protein
MLHNAGSLKWVWTFKDLRYLQILVWFPRRTQVMFGNLRYIQGVSKRALQIWNRIEIYTENIHNVLNCQNVAKHTKFYLGYLFATVSTFFRFLLPRYQWKSHWTITIRGKTRCVLLHFDSSKRCLHSLYAFKVVSYLGEVREYLNTRFQGRWTVTVEVPWRRNRKKRSKQLRITIWGKTRRVLLHFDNSKRCVCPLYKFLYAFKVVKLFLKHPVFTIHRQSNPFTGLDNPWRL